MTSPSPSADPSLSALDVFRLAIAKQLRQILDVPEDVAFAAIDLGKKGVDFTAVIPRLKLKGPPKEWTDKVVQSFVPDEHLERVEAAPPFLHFYAKTATLTRLVLDKIHSLSIPSPSHPNGAYGTNAAGKGKKVVIESSSPNIAKPFHAGHLRSTIIGAFLNNLFKANGWEVVSMNYLGDWGKQFGLLAVGFERYGNEEKLNENAIMHLFDVYVRINREAEAEKAKSQLEIDPLKAEFEPAQEALQAQVKGAKDAAEAARLRKELEAKKKEHEAEVEKIRMKYEVTNEKAREFFKRMETGDETALSVWRRFRDLSIVKYEEVYARLNVGYDVYAGESKVLQEQIQSAMDSLKSQGLLTTKTKEESNPEWSKNKKKAAASKAASDAPTTANANGATGTTSSEEKPPAPPEDVPAQEDATENTANLALAIDLEKWKLGKPVVQKPDGTTIYIIRDIAGAIQRYQTYSFDKMIYVIGDQQDAHVAQFFKILELMKVPFADRMEHVNFGRVNGMSTRRGEVKFLDEILDMAKDAMMDQMKSNEKKFSQVEDPVFTSDQIGMTCVKVQDMSAKRVKAYDFDPQRMTSIEGDTGAYLQYAHARLCSLERRVAPNLVLRSSPEQIDVGLLTEPKTREIVYFLATYPDVVKTAFKVYEPSTVVSFCFGLAHLIASAWETIIVLNQEEELAQARLYLYTCARNVLGSAMRLLTLVPLERM